jgi:hypothetical protein
VFSVKDLTPSTARPAAVASEPPGTRSIPEGRELVGACVGYSRGILGYNTLVGAKVLLTDFDDRNHSRHKDAADDLVKFTQALNDIVQKCVCKALYIRIVALAFAWDVVITCFIVHNGTLINTVAEINIFVRGVVTLRVPASIR